MKHKNKQIQTGKSGDGIEFINTMKKSGGFFDLPKLRVCKSPEHEPPQYMVIPQGKGYKHVCPVCGETVIIIPQQYSY